jgi:hypothetical protein
VRARPFDLFCRALTRRGYGVLEMYYDFNFHIRAFGQRGNLDG